MTVAQLLSFVGSANLNDTLAEPMLREADKVAAAHVKAARGAILNVNNGHHHEAFERIARKVCGVEMDAEEETLKAADDQLPREFESVVDAAGNRYNPVIEAAYAFGLALGVRLGSASK